MHRAGKQLIPREDKAEKLGFIHRFVPSKGSQVTLLLLHGTGGDENNLLPLGSDLLPGAALLSPRGRVLENGMPRFFRRTADGVFDRDDLEKQTHGLASFVTEASKGYRFDISMVVAVGYSNGANIASSITFTPTSPCGRGFVSSDGDSAGVAKDSRP